MTDRIDHAAEAQKVLAMPTSVWGSSSEVLAGAQVNATLAIVEQLRIGNLIALGYGGDEADCDQARADARAALVDWHAHEDPEMGGWPEIRPDIAAALGIDLNGSPRLKPGDFNLKLHPKPRKEVPNV